METVSGKMLSKKQVAKWVKEKSRKVFKGVNRTTQTHKDKTKETKRIKFNINQGDWNNEK